MTFPNGDIFEGTYVKCEIPDPVAVAEAEAAAAEAAAAAAENAENAENAEDAENADGDAPPRRGEKPPSPPSPRPCVRSKGRYVFVPLVADQELSGGYHEGEYVDNKKHGPGVAVFPRRIQVRGSLSWRAP